jgi:hypothetical protein
MNTEKLNSLSSLIEEKTAFISKVNEDMVRFNATKAAVSAVLNGNEDIVNAHFVNFVFDNSTEFKERIKTAAKYENELPELHREMDCIRRGVYFDHEETLTYFWGRKSQTVRIRNEGEEIVFRVLQKIMGATYTSKANAFRVLFGFGGNSTEYNCWSLSDILRVYSSSRKETFVTNAREWCKNRTEYADVLELLNGL